jgi:hypothetical protein
LHVVQKRGLGGKGFLVQPGRERVLVLFGLGQLCQPGFIVRIVRRRFASGDGRQLGVKLYPMLGRADEVSQRLAPLIFSRKAEVVTE